MSQMRCSSGVSSGSVTGFFAVCITFSFCLGIELTLALSAFRRFDCDQQERDFSEVA